METAVSLLFEGLTLGLIYALMSCGFSLIYGICHQLNFAHGELVMLGSFIMLFFYGKWGQHWVLTLGLGMAILAAIGFLLEKKVFSRFRGPEWSTHMRGVIAAVAVQIIIPAACLLAFGSRDYGIPSIMAGNVIHIGNAIISAQKLILFSVSLSMVIGMQYFVFHTKIGLAIRAEASDSEIARLYGVRSSIVAALSFTIGCALAGASGVLIAPMFYVNPFIGPWVLTMVLLSVVIGGLGSFTGALIGGLFVGLVQSIAGFFISGLSELVLFTIAIFLLIVRPQGIMGVAWRM